MTPGEAKFWERRWPETSDEVDYALLHGLVGPQEYKRLYLNEWLGDPMDFSPQAREIEWERMRRENGATPSRNVNSAMSAAAPQLNVHQLIHEKIDRLH